MIFGRSIPLPQVVVVVVHTRVGIGIKMSLEVQHRRRQPPRKWASVRKSSTVSPFSYHAKERAENCISVRSASRGGVNPSFLARFRLKKLFHLVQKPITRHLVVAARPAKPTRPETAYETPKREGYPDEVLTHRFRPYGDPGDLPLEDPMDVEIVEVSPKDKEKSKRRAGEAGSSKKKKAKLVASQ